ncbi:MAG: GNAT family N-acetyltransferase [Agromyces sp.]
MTARDLARKLRAVDLEPPFEAAEYRTDRLLLRPHRLEDAAEWVQLQSHASVREFLSWPERTETESVAHLKKRTGQTTLHVADDFLALAVELDGQLIGDVSMHLRAARATVRSVEAGWVISPEWSGRGFATEAARELLRIAFDEIGAVVVFAVVHEDNIASRQLSERLGFTLASQQGRDLSYSLTRAAWSALPGV